MATEVRDVAAQQGPIADWEEIDHYVDWQQREGVPVITGFYIDDLKSVELGPWERKGGKGAFVVLEGTGGVNDTHLVEIGPGGKSAPERHLYEEMTYVLTGRGATTVWYDDGQKQTFEWGTGSLFAIPVNATYQHFNGSGTEPARYASVTNAPTVLRMFHNSDFIFNNPFKFEDRFSAQDGYFNGQGKLFKKRYRHVWTTNFVPDVHTMKLHTWAQRGGGGANVMLELADNTMGAHISEFAIGMYKKAHRHGPGAHVVILDGVGYSLLWKNDFSEHIKCDWKPGAVIVPPEDWFHEHFNTGNEPARYLALRYSGLKHRQAYNVQRGDGSDVSVKEGGWQIEYEDEDPSVHQVFESELKKHGATCQMKGYVPDRCTGIVGNIPG
jgi:oxalate decarboxylase/phosphoglucose isomerase-like protein (cupin superfamily)